MHVTRRDLTIMSAIALGASSPLHSSTALPTLTMRRRSDRRSKRCARLYCRRIRRNWSSLPPIS